MHRTRYLAVLLAAVVAAACSGGGDAGPTEAPRDGASEISAIVGNSELAVGDNRVTVALVGPDGERIEEAQGQTVVLRFSFGGDPASEYDARFVWAIPGVTGFFVVNAVFPQAGDWVLVAAIRQDGVEQLSLPRDFTVRESSLAPNVGDAAPRSENLTLADVSDVRQISTDDDLEPALYELTVAEALDIERPLVVVFATPAFCRTQFCGPVVDNVKEVWEEFAGRVSFVHIEPFELDEQGQLVLAEDAAGRPDIVPVAAVFEWNLQTEPWVFVVDGTGRVTARFEGTASVEELRDAVEQALG